MKKIDVKICPQCKKEFIGKKNFCSKNCRDIDRFLSLVAKLVIRVLEEEENNNANS